MSKRIVLIFSLLALLTSSCMSSYQPQQRCGNNRAAKKKWNYYNKIQYR